MAIFSGTYTNKVDRKGRVSVPARFRAQIAGQDFQGVVAAPAEAQRVLDAMDAERLEELVDRMDKPGAITPEQQSAIDLMMGDAEHLPFDGDGRVMLPKHFLDHADITDTALFTGVGRSFRIWNPERHAEYKANTRAQLGKQALSLRDLSQLGHGTDKAGGGSA